jgi:hypothetical protein
MIAKSLPEESWLFWEFDKSGFHNGCVYATSTAAPVSMAIMTKRVK